MTNFWRISWLLEKEINALCDWKHCEIEICLVLVSHNPFIEYVSLFDLWFMSCSQFIPS